MEILDTKTKEQIEARVDNSNKVEAQIEVKIEAQENEVTSEARVEEKLEKKSEAHNKVFRNLRKQKLQLRRRKRYETHISPSPKLPPP